MTIRTSPLQRIPGVFRHYRHLLPIMPLAARTWRIKDVDLVISLSHCVAKAVVPPPGVPHVCYCFTPMRYAWQGRDAYLESWSDRPVRQALARTMLERLRRWDFATASRVTHFVAISETIRERIAECYRRESRVIQPPVNVNFYSPIPRVPRDDSYLVVSALVPYKRIDQAVAACTESSRPLIVIGEGPERARLQAMAGPTVRFLGWQRDEVIGDYYRSCRALLFPGEEDFGIVPIEALAVPAPVIALGRGGVAETVDDTVGRTTPSRSRRPCSLRSTTGKRMVAAMIRLEAATDEPRRTHNPCFDGRILRFLAEVMTESARHRGAGRRALESEGRISFGSPDQESSFTGR